MSLIRILSLDGGGVHGMISAHILDHIEQETGKPISTIFDIICGVSIGGIISLILTKPDNTGKNPEYPARDIVNVFRKYGDTIFLRSPWIKPFQFIPGVLLLHDLFFSKYDQSGITKVLYSLLGETRLSQALTEVLIPAYDIGPRGKGKSDVRIFSSRQSSLTGVFQEDFLMQEVGLATTAAPLYFAPQRMHVITAEGKRVLSPYRLVDGGIVVNNPILLSFLQGRSQFPNQNISLLSIGCSTPNCDYHNLNQRKSPGFLSWFNALAYLISGPQTSFQQRVFYSIAKESHVDLEYIRIEPPHWSWKFFSSIDNISTEHLDALDRIFYNLIRGPQKDTIQNFIHSLREER